MDAKAMDWLARCLPEEARGENERRAAMGKLLFRGDAVYRQNKVLSGGEKARMKIASLTLQGPNLLALDEPTNHLDIVSQHWVEQYLKHYQGALIVISHDRAFLDGVVNKVLEVSPGSTRMLTCNVSEYIERLEQETAEKLGK